MLPPRSAARIISSAACCQEPRSWIRSGSFRINILDTIAKAGAGFKSLADIWADTTTAQGRLMLTILGGRAEFERELILARTGDGRKRAKVPWGAFWASAAPTPVH